MQSLEDGLSFVAGEFVGGNGTFDNINPATEEVIGSAADCDTADMARAVEAADHAFATTDWAHDPKFRRQCLEQLQEALVAEQAHIESVLIAEAGCPRSLLDTAQVGPPIKEIAYWAQMATEFPYEDSLPDNDFLGMLSARKALLEPIGVVGAITPWNFPLFLNLAKVAPALAAGCTVVLKPAPDTPWSATLLGRIAAETDIPPGVFNVVTSSDHQIGAALAEDPRVNLVSFTGSTRTGQSILASASKHLRRTVLELGGKSASIVLDAEHLAMGASMTCMQTTMHAGQGCALTTRLLVPRELLDEALQICTVTMQNIPQGDPDTAGHVTGPLISARQRERVLGYIEKGKSEAPLLVGGGTPEQFDKGYYVQPTLFGPVPPEAVIAQEEIFGPVLVVIPFDSVEDAVTIANGTQYGLSGAVFGDDEEAMAVTRRLRTGTVNINGGMFAGADMAFGGWGMSGLGRENGVEGFREFLESKAVGIRR